MLEYIENIKLINITEGKSSISRDYVNRPMHGLIYKIGATSAYRFGDERFIHHNGEFIFIPKGASYHVEKLNDDGSRYIAINFDADIKGAPFIYKYSGNTDLKLLPHLWLMGSTSDKCRCLSVFYDILASLTVSEEKREQKKADMIAPASEYLKKHIFEHALNTEKLHRLCGISDVYFRKIFKSIYGVSPRKFIIEKRLTQARSIIESGDYDSIASVAFAVGYDDPLYFSREFKNKYGISPSSI